MIITRGKLKGTKATMHQFSNDWISADSEDGKPLILNPTSVQLEPGELDVFRSHTSVGQFWSWYAFDPVGLRFIKRRHRT